MTVLRESEINEIAQKLNKYGVNTMIGSCLNNARNKAYPTR